VILFVPNLQNLNQKLNGIFLIWFVQKPKTINSMSKPASLKSDVRWKSGEYGDRDVCSSVKGVENLPEKPHASTNPEHLPRISLDRSSEFNFSIQSENLPVEKNETKSMEKTSDSIEDAGESSETNFIPTPVHSPRSTLQDPSEKELQDDSSFFPFTPQAIEVIQNNDHEQSCDDLLSQTGVQAIEPKEDSSNLGNSLSSSSLQNIPSKETNSFFIRRGTENKSNLVKTIPRIMKHSLKISNDKELSVNANTNLSRPQIEKKLFPKQPVEIPHEGNQLSPDTSAGIRPKNRLLAHSTWKRRTFNTGDKNQANMFLEKPRQVVDETESKETFTGRPQAVICDGEHENWSLCQFEKCRKPLWNVFVDDY
jgi:hypothetical protein